ncbi:hypothetical protein AYO21_10996 [Fonsecaea monophora]|uniref:Uncharacterized protein n=1 Tax=Fonsecaea monophora TaxID=254056 RepID=A0A177ES59_9EURO|nr:hypothetical protein AYO21_10996 [Fonsecaea monophora]KAH0837610.1 hypothetical protein FOPE_04936 [Fonsecaea pedrosoi]OAG34834.1 hypothetical protein AYO21_10996 [Fonsecaea monophora]
MNPSQDTPSPSGLGSGASSGPSASQAGTNPPAQLPVIRSLAFQATPSTPPEPEGEVQEEARMTAFRHQAAYPHMLSRDVVRTCLKNNGWDVNRAVAAYRWQGFRQGATTPSSATTGPHIRNRTTVERERLHQVHEMQSALRQGDPKWTTGNLEMMLLHHAYNFVPEDIAEAIVERDGNYDDFEDEAARLRQPADSQLALDQRLALFLNISATNSVYSARQLLNSHNWDVAAAIEAWMTAGKVHVTFPPFDPEDEKEADDGLRAVNANRPPQIQGSRFIFFDHDSDKFNQWLTKKRKRDANHSDLETSNPETAISGGQPEELSTVLSSPPSTLKKRRKNAVDGMESGVQSRPGPDNDSNSRPEDSGQDLSETSRKPTIRVRGRGPARYWIREEYEDDGDVGKSNSDDEDEDDVPGRDYISGNRGATGNPRGALIDLDRRPAVVHCPDRTKLYVEYIKKGKYKFERFQGQSRGSGRRNVPFRWDDMDDDEVEEVEFDWHNKRHIAQLNRWRNDRFVQITGIGRGEPNGGPFNKYEEQWLVEQEGSRIEKKFYERAGLEETSPKQTGNPPNEAYERTKEQFESGNNFPIPLTSGECEDLVERFNAAFSGKRFFSKTIYKSATFQSITKDMSRVSDVPRPPRSNHEIRQHRCRIAAYAKHFMLKPDKAKFTNVDDEDYLKSDSDSDFELERAGEAAAIAAGGAGATANSGADQGQADNQTQIGTGGSQAVIQPDDQTMIGTGGFQSALQPDANAEPQSGSGADPSADTMYRGSTMYGGNTMYGGSTMYGASTMYQPPNTQDEEGDEEDSDLYGA